MNRTHGSTQHRENGQVFFYLNKHTQESRHCFLPMDADLERFHDGFTSEDWEQGWQIIVGMSATHMSDAAIEAEHDRLPGTQQVIANHLDNQSGSAAPGDMDEKQMLDRIDLLAEEMDANDEENHSMQSEIDTLYKKIDALKAGVAIPS